MDCTFYRKQTDPRGKTVCRRGEGRSRERPHQDVRARTFERSGTRSEERRNPEPAGCMHGASSHGDRFAEENV